MGALRSLALKIFGPPPPKGAPRLQQLRWIRGFYLRPLPLVVVVFTMLILWASQTYTFVLLAVSAAIWLQGLVSLSLRIRREERGDA